MDILGFFGSCDFLGYNRQTERQADRQTDTHTKEFGFKYIQTPWKLEFGFYQERN